MSGSQTDLQTIATSIYTAKSIDTVSTASIQMKMLTKEMGLGVGRNMFNEDIQIIVTLGHPLSRRRPYATKKTIWNRWAGCPSMTTISCILALW
jgi:hypothetical protein